MQNRILILSIVLLLKLKGIAQNINIAGIFPTIDHSGKLNKKLDYSIYYFGAFPAINLYKPNFSWDGNFHLFYAEQAISFSPSSKFSLTGSYVYQRANVVYNDYINENRFYIQGKYKHIFSKINITHRLRFDGRFIQDRIMNETPFTNRVRYLFGMDASLNEKTYITAYEEAFFDTKLSYDKFFTENWAYLAYGRKLNSQNKVEAGILYVTWNIGNNNWFNQYYLQITWINLLDFSRINKK